MLFNKFLTDGLIFRNLYYIIYLKQTIRTYYSLLYFIRIRRKRNLGDIIPQ
jgi:hypothetical protein